MISRKVATSASTEGDLSSSFSPLSHAQEQNLLHAKQRVIDGVRAILNQVFDDCDDMIFNMAEKSETNAEQAKYFDYLNQVRLQRKGTILAVASGQLAWFQTDSEIEQACGFLSKGVVSISLEEGDAKDLLLVDNDCLEENLLTESVIQKITTNNRKDLDDLRAHIMVLLRSSMADFNLLDPKHLVDTFAQSLRDYQVDREPRLLLVKLLSKALESSLPTLLEEVLAELPEEIDEDVLSELTGMAAAQSDGDDWSDMEDGLDDYERFDFEPPAIKVSLPVVESNTAPLDVSSNNGGVDSGVIQASSGVAAAPQVAMNYVAVPSQALPEQTHSQNMHPQQVHSNQALSSQSQSTNPVQDANASGQDMPHSSPSSSDVMTNQEANNHYAGEAVESHNGVQAIPGESAAPQASGSGGEYQLNLSAVPVPPTILVRSAFEQVRQNELLPNFLKVQMDRMETPLTQIVEQSPEIMQQDDHPAWQFMNQLAQIGLSLGGANSDFLEKKIESFVDQATSNYRENPNVISELLKDLHPVVTREQKRNDMLEKRVREAAQGRLRQEQAKEDVRVAMIKSMGGLLIPTQIAPLLNAWGRYLLYVVCRHGGQSAQMSRGLEDIEHLVQLLQPVQQEQDADQEKHERLKALPDLINNISDGLDFLSISDYEITDIFNSLESIITARLLGGFQHSATVEEILRAQSEQVLAERAQSDKVDDQARAVSDEAVETDLDDVEDESQSNASADDEEAVSPENQLSFDLAEEIRKSRELRDNSELIRSDESKRSAPVPVLDDDELPETSEFVRQVDLLVIGTQVEFRTAELGRVKCKLTACLKEYGKWIFTNAMGETLFEKGRNELAMDFKLGNCVAISDRSIFNDALAQVIRDNRG